MFAPSVRSCRSFRSDELNTILSTATSFGGWRFFCCLDSSWTSLSIPNDELLRHLESTETTYSNFLVINFNQYPLFKTVSIIKSKLHAVLKTLRRFLVHLLFLIPSLVVLCTSHFPQTVSLRQNVTIHFITGSAGGKDGMKPSSPLFRPLKLYITLTPAFSPVTDGFQVSAELWSNLFQVSRCCSRKPVSSFHGDVVAKLSLLVSFALFSTPGFTLCFRCQYCPKYYPHISTLYSVDYAAY